MVTEMQGEQKPKGKVGLWIGVLLLGLGVAVFVGGLYSGISGIGDTVEGYHRLPLDPDVHPVRLAAGGTPVPHCEVYVGVRGPLLDDADAPVPLHAITQAQARALHADRQRS